VGTFGLDGKYIGVESVTFGSSLENIGANAFRGSTLAGNLDLSVATNLTIATVRAPPPALPLSPDAQTRAATPRPIAAASLLR